MAQAKKKPKTPSSTIALNKRARHEYSLEHRFEAGLVLEGWEVKSLREGKVQLVDSFVLLKNGEAFLFGCHISPLGTTAAYSNPDPTRSRKLLLRREELNKLIGAVDRKGYALIPTAMYWSHGRAKLEIGLAKGKKDFDKRADLKDRDWSRQKQRLLKHG